MKIPEKTPEYDDLIPLNYEAALVYGPIQSRRFGLSLGINLLHTQEKLCSFNCAYCELGPTTLRMSEIKKHPDYPTIESLEEAFRQKLVSLSQEKNAINTITVSGFGESTLHPEFSAISEMLRKVQKEMAPSVPIALLSNGSTLDQSKVVRAINQNYDLPVVKLDAGNDPTQAKINNPLVRTSVAKIIQGAKKVDNLQLQSMFVHGDVDNTKSSEVEEWIEVCGIIKPKHVQIMSLDRVPQQTGLKQVAPQILKDISKRLFERTRIKSTVFC